MKALENRSIFNINLVRFRKAKHLTQVELAKLIGIERSLLGLYETRDIYPPSSVLLRLSKALDVSMHDLLEEHTVDPANDISQIDPRTLRKIFEITELSRKDRSMIYSVLSRLRKFDNSEKSDTSGKTPPKSSNDET